MKWLSVLVFLAASQAQAATLSGNVSFDGENYTYDYTVVNDTPSTIWNVDLFVGRYPTEPLGLYAVQPIPAAYSAPSGWTMYGAFSGSIAEPPYNMNGGFYEFYGPALGADTMTPGFSFTTSYAPTTASGANDFFTYGAAGIVAFGNTVVPNGADWLVEGHAIPLPATIWLMAAPLLWLGRKAVRKGR